MPAPDSQTDYGVAHFYGLYDTRTYMTVQSDSITTTYKLDVEVTDENGRVITDRLDDERNEVSIDGTMKSEGSEDLLGGTFSYGGVTFIVKGVTDRGTNNDYRKVTIKGVKYQEIA